MGTMTKAHRSPAASAGSGRHWADRWSYFAGLPRAAASGLVDLLLLWQERANERHALAHLGDHALKDIGLSRADAVREAGKPFWRV